MNTSSPGVVAMFERVLFRLCAELSEPRVLLGSWQLSVALMTGAAVFYVLLAIYSWSVPTHVVSNIAGLWTFRLAWTLIIINTCVCLWNRWRGTQWASVLFHGSFLLVVLGMLLTAAARHETKIWVAHGESFTGDAGQFLTAPGASQPPPFVLASITPEFWREELLFTKLEAELDLGGQRRVTKINRPLWIGAASFLRLSGFGFAPRYELRDGTGQVVESAFAKMNVFPPGTTDFVMPAKYPYRIYLEVYPDAEVRDGDVVNRTMSLRRPVLVVHVYRGHLPIASAPLKIGEELVFEGLRLRFPEVRVWGELTWVRDPGAPVVFLGFLAGMAGLLVRLWRRA